ncbi:MAG: Ig-like domain-containing protein [Rhodoluna sp.]|nr:Ig-like domain-containing protein [Rhodoluna sp.]
MTYVRAQAVLDLTSKQLDTGEAVTYTQPLVSGIFSLFYVDEQGRMNWLSTMDTKKFGWVRWNSTASNSSLPAGVTVTGQDSLFTVAAGGKLTITGTGLGTISAVTVGGNRATFTKTATKLVVTLPKNLSGDKPVSATFPGAVIADLANIKYVGAAKQAQTITTTANVSGTWTGATSKVTTSFPATTSVGLPTSLKVDNAAVCSVAGQTVTMNAAGTCVVTVSSAGDLGTSARSQNTSIVVAKGDLALSVASTLSVTNNSADISGNTLNTRTLNPSVAVAASDLADFTFASSNEDICTVDEDGNVTGVATGSCMVTTSAVADANWLAASRNTAVTVTDSASEIPDVMPEIGDGNLPAKAITNNKSLFVTTNDSSLGVKWDKAAGLLTLQSKGVYIGFIKAEVTFTKDGVTYTCTNVFGTTAALASKTAAQKKAALKSKVFTAGAASCKDASALSLPVSIGAAADFAKIKKVAKDKAAANTVVGSAKYEALALTKLKNFVGTVTIKITRYRAWPTTMKNVAGAKKIPAVVRTTVISLQ